MNTLIMHGDGLVWVVLFLVFLAFGVPLILFVIGILLRNKNKKASKILLIIAVIYSLIGFGICGGDYF